MNGKYTRKKARAPSARYAIPFVVVLAVMTVISFIIPLRPTKSYSEKRALAEFPDFSVEALLDGSYFDDITLWFSDTFPGRETWLKAANSLKQFHGANDIVINGEIGGSDEIPTAPMKPADDETDPTETGSVQLSATDPSSESFATEPVTEPLPTETEAPPTDPIEKWGGINAGEDAEIILGKVVQIGDSAFNYFSFSQPCSDRYVKAINRCADLLSDKGIRVVSALIPSAIGVLVEPEYQEKLKCADQGAAIDYMLSSMNDKVYKVNMFPLLVDHNSEYIYFRTDHHWTALGAYYGYQAICETLGMETAELSDFEEWDQGTFRGTLYYNCSATNKLKLDNVYAYNPPNELTFWISNNGWSSFPWTVLTDMSKSDIGSKYMVFIAGDHALCQAINDSIPDAPNCVVIKDSCGNPVIPFLTQNYHNVYVMDFREYNRMGLSAFCEKYNIDDVIFCHMLGMAQGDGAVNLISNLCK